MTVKTHTITSAALAYSVYTLSESPAMSIAAFISGVFIDLDHILDFFIFSGERFSPKNFFSWCYSRWEKSIFPLHSWEFYILVFFANIYVQNTIITGILLGTGLHLLLDQIGNRYFLKTTAIKPLFYFIAFRASKGFRKEKTVEIKQAESDL